MARTKKRKQNTKENNRTPDKRNQEAQSEDRHPTIPTERKSMKAYWHLRTQAAQRDDFESWECLRLYCELYKITPPKREKKKHETHK